MRELQVIQQDPTEVVADGEIVSFSSELLFGDRVGGVTPVGRWREIESTEVTK